MFKSCLCPTIHTSTGQLPPQAIYPEDAARGGVISRVTIGAFMDLYGKNQVSLQAANELATCSSTLKAAKAASAQSERIPLAVLD